MLAFARYVHTSTIAVHGASPRSIMPAIYSLWMPCGIMSLYISLMKTHAINAIVNGFMAQFMAIVRNSGFGFFRTLSISSKLIFSISGYIIASITAATGIETFATSILPKYPDKFG